MTLAFWLRSSLTMLVSFSPAILAAGPVDPPTWEAVDKTLGRPGRVLPGDVHRYGWPRSDLHVTVGGAEVAPTLALGSWAGLFKASTEGHVMAMGDFVLVAEEVNPVIRELESHGIQVTALHSHMLRESPRLFFMHFWGLDDPARIGEGLKSALSKVAVQ